MLSRRSLLQGFAATLAAAAVLPSGELLAADDHARLAYALKNGGVVENLEFVFYNGQPIEIGGVPNLVMRNCKFIWRGVRPVSFLKISEGNFGEDGSLVSGCSFVCETRGLALHMGTA